MVIIMRNITFTHIVITIIQFIQILAIMDAGIEVGLVVVAVIADQLKSFITLNCN